MEGDLEQSNNKKNAKSRKKENDKNTMRSAPQMTHLMIVQPLVDAFGVVEMHTRQLLQALSPLEFHHANSARGLLLGPVSRISLCRRLDPRRVEGTHRGGR